MSHVVVIKTKLNDLAAIKAACVRLGWKFHEGKTSYEWFGEWVNDYHGEDAAYQNGIKPEDYGKCDHAISIPGAKYEIGLVKQADGTYQPIWDNWPSGGLQGLKTENGMTGFLQAYAIERAKGEARKKGFSTSEVKEAGGRVRLIVNAR